MGADWAKRGGWEEQRYKGNFILLLLYNINLDQFGHKLLRNHHKHRLETQEGMPFQHNTQSRARIILPGYYWERITRAKSTK